jgi:hypothetical protein
MAQKIIYVEVTRRIWNPKIEFRFLGMTIYREFLLNSKFHENTERGSSVM